jgi:HK97 gp10 family phage protein
MAEIDIEINGLKETQKEMERIVTDLRGEPFLNGMRRATLLVQRSAKIKAPVDTGRLRASITPEVRWQGNTAVGVVGSNVKYAPFVELGTRPHFVPQKYIGVWASRHGLDNAGLFVSGKPQPFLQPAFEENAAKIVQILGDTVATIISEGSE